MARLGRVVEHHPMAVVGEDARRGLRVRLLPRRRARQSRRAVAAPRVRAIARIGGARDEGRDVVTERVARREGVVGPRRVEDLGIRGVTASFVVVRRRAGAAVRWDEGGPGARGHRDVRCRGRGHGRRGERESDGRCQRQDHRADAGSNQAALPPHQRSRLRRRSLVRWVIGSGTREAMGSRLAVFPDTGIGQKALEPEGTAEFPPARVTRTAQQRRRQRACFPASSAALPLWS